jgi:tetratricopeptide (TPR) repeat protein
LKSGGRSVHSGAMRYCLILLLLVCGALPAAAQSPGKAADSKKLLDGLLTALQAAPDEAHAALLEARIRQMWLQAGSPAATMLMGRGIRDLSNQAADEALDDFNAVLALEPDLADAFALRAQARAGLGDYAGAVADIQSTLQREPRQFGAWKSLSAIAEDHKDYKGALAAWQKVLSLSPKTPGGDKRLKSLEREAYGEAT